MAYGNSAFYTTDAAGDVATTYALPAGSSRVLHLFALHEESSGSRQHSALAFGGATASKRASTNGQYEGGNAGAIRNWIEHWYILEADLGSVGSNPSINFTPAASATGITGVVIICTTGSDQNPANWGTPVTDNKTNDVGMSAAVSGAVGDTVIGGAVCSLGGNSFATTNATEVTSSDANINGTATRVVGFYADLASTSVTVSVDNANNTNTAYQSMFAVCIPQAAADSTPPTLSGATIGTNGTTVTLNFSESVSIGAGGNGGFAITPSGGAATLTYSSGSGSSSLVYTASRTINAGETVTVAYTQPGNGVEDAAGNDLATFGSTSVTNNSTQGAPTISSFDSTPEHLATEALTGTGLPTSQTGSAAVKFVGAIETVTLTPTYNTSTALSAVFDVGNNRFGVSATVTVTDSSGAVSSGYSVTPQPRAGGAYVNLSTLAAAAFRLEAIPDLQSGYQVEYYGGVGCTCGTDLILFDDATVQYPADAVGFYARAHNGTSWGAPAFISISDLIAERRGAIRSAVKAVVRPVTWDTTN